MATNWSGFFCALLPWQWAISTHIKAGCECRSKINLLLAISCWSHFDTRAQVVLRCLFCSLGSSRLWMLFWKTRSLTALESFQSVFQPGSGPTSVREKVSYLDLHKPPAGGASAGVGGASTGVGGASTGVGGASTGVGGAFTGVGRAFTGVGVTVQG
jgi:hypothetical protein